jgi:Asp-tRNA(Asn)/Glu-tRNA(Gln) amidotransferase A subunit family amidase
MPGEDVLYLSVRELAERIHTRAISPVELTEAYLERSRSIGAKLNAYVTLTPELARAEAKQAEAEIAGGRYRGMLHGIPYAAKDLLAVRGYPTTWGARMFADRKFDYDATVIRKLHDAGAILIGKAAMIGLAGGSADDCGIVLSAIAGHDPADAASLSDGAFSYDDAAQAPLRIGWLTNAWKNPPGQLDAAVNEARRVMSDAGAQMEPATLPEGPWEVAAGVVVSVEGASAFGDLIDSGKVSQLTDPLGRIGGYVNRQIPASDYVRAQRVRGILQRKIDTLFEKFDVLAAASQPVTATPLSTNLETGLDYADPLGGIGNFCGLPSLSVPCGFVNSLPVGVQFVGRVYDDLKVIAAARLFQQHTDWHRRRPALA